MAQPVPPKRNPQPEARAERLATLRKALPDAPGVYKYKDAQGEIIYVGKATSLKKRVNSYFTKGHVDFKTHVLVEHIADIDVTVTQTDLEALLLENSLIKQHQPKYNLLLKDGKSYPYICIKKERFPRVFPTRNKIPDGSSYYGPYPSVSTMKLLLRFIKDNFQLRNCNLHLSEKNIESGKFRVCLEYQLGNCAGPCEGKQSEESYNEDILQIRQILRGRFSGVLQEIESQMQQAAQAMDFERANFLKTRIDNLHKLKRKSIVMSEQVGDVEVFTLAYEEQLAVVHHFKVLSGTVVGTHSYDVKRRNEDSPAEMLEAVLSAVQLEEEDALSNKLLSNIDLQGTELAERFATKVPTRGDEAKLVALSKQNAEATLEEKLNISRLKRKQDPMEATLRQLQKDLHLKTYPAHIECFDNSNIQGYAPVASCVVFRNGKPARRDYRVYNIKTVEGPDDFASMKEVVGRRYRRLKEEGQPLPDLIVIDGGKGQLSHALEALAELQLERQIPIVSIAKRLEEIYFMHDPIPLYIDKKSASLRLLQRLRNEAHNTAINFHRKKRGQKTLKTGLTEIPGIGQKTARKLLTHFKSLKNIKAASPEALAEVIGPAKAAEVYGFFAEE